MLLVPALAALALLAPPPFSSAFGAGGCSYVASAAGHAGASGSASDPFGSVQDMIEHMSAGQTGCVRGSITGNVAIRRPDLTLTSEPGQRGRVVGQLKVMPGGDRASVLSLDIDGVVNPDMPTVGLYANDVSFVDDDVTNENQEICFILGYIAGNVVAERPLIQGNRIHNCGERPVSNMDHGIYVESAADGRIIGNDIYDNADRGIQLYPRAQRMQVVGNVLNGNGEGIIFGGDDVQSANGNVVRYNVISNSRLRSDVESYYSSGVAQGVGNVVERNCISGSGINTSNGGFSASDNVTGPVSFTDPASFSLAPGSVCASLLAAGRAGSDFVPPVKAPTGTKPASSTSPISVTVGASGPAPVLTVALTDAGVDSATTVVQVRYGNGKWTTVAKPKIGHKKAYRKRLAASRKGKRATVRVSVTSLRRNGKTARPKRRVFSAAAPAPRF